MKIIGSGSFLLLCLIGVLIFNPSYLSAETVEAVCGKEILDSDDDNYREEACVICILQSKITGILINDLTEDNFYMTDAYIGKAKITSTVTNKDCDGCYEICFKPVTYSWYEGYDYEFNFLLKNIPDNAFAINGTLAGAFNVNISVR